MNFKRTNDMSDTDDVSPQILFEWRCRQRRADDIEDQMEVLKSELRGIEQRMEQLENEWLESHRCSCELLGLDCTHSYPQ